MKLIFLMILIIPSLSLADASPFEGLWSGELDASIRRQLKCTNTNEESVRYSSEASLVQIAVRKENIYINFIGGCGEDYAAYYYIFNRNDSSLFGSGGLKIGDITEDKISVKFGPADFSFNPRVFELEFKLAEDKLTVYINNSYPASRPPSHAEYRLDGQFSKVDE